MGTAVHLNTSTTLGELAAKYTTPDFIADLVVPVTVVERKLVKFWKFNRRDVLRISSAEIAPDGDPNQRKFTASTAEATVKPYALFDKIPLSDIEDAEPGIELESDTVEDLTHDMLLGREKRVSDLIMTAANYATANKVTLGTAWTNPATSTPITDIQTGKRACAVTPNIAVCDEVTFDALARHPDIVATLRGMGGAVRGLATAQEIAGYFGLEQIYVGRCKYDSANAGAALVEASVWPSGRFLLAKVVAQPRMREVTLARTYRFNLPGSNEKGLLVQTGDSMLQGTAGVRLVKVAMEEVTDHVAADCGYLISGAA